MSLRYEPRKVGLVGRIAERDPSLLEVCGPHADRLSQPMGWRSDRDTGSLAAGVD